MIRLNIGSGHKEDKDWINIDKRKESEDTVVLDLEVDAFPYEDGTVSVIRAEHILEHLGDGLFHCLDECWRVLMPSGFMSIRVPKYPHEDAIKDPTHKRFFVEETFRYFEYDTTCHMYGWRQWRIMEMTTTDNEIIVQMRPDQK